MAKLICPSCHTSELRPTHCRGFLENFKKKLGGRAFRCRDHKCNWRGLIKTKSTKKIIEGFIMKHGPTIIFLLGFVILGFLILKIVIGSSGGGGITGND